MSTGARVRITDSTLRLVATLVDDSGLCDWAEQSFRAQLGTYRGGQRMQLSWRTLLIGLGLLAVTEQPMILRDVVRTLNSLEPAQQLAAGVTVTVTERMISRRFNTFIDLIDPSEYSERNRRRAADLTAEERAADLARRDAALRYVLDAIIGASLPADDHGSGCYAIDATGVPSWARQNKKWKVKQISTDPDANWRAQKTSVAPRASKDASKPVFSGKAWYGYWLHAAARIPSLTVGKDGTITRSDTPAFIERIDVTSANSDMAVDAARLLTRITASPPGGAHGPAGKDVVVDRAYSHDYERFLEPARALGFDAHFDLRSDQRGLGGSVRGMVIVDGQPYSPSMPESLHAIDPPKFPGTTRAQLQLWQAQVALRAPYAIKLRGRTNAGDFELSCPAARDFGAMRCSAKPESLMLGAHIPTAPPTNLGSPLPDICAQQRMRVPAEDLPLWQPFQYGSEGWWTSMNRRARVEGMFGNLKNDATQSLQRGRIRVMGLAKTALMTAFLAAAVNLRLAERRARERQQTGPAKPIVRRGPRPRTRRLAVERERRLTQAAEAARAAAPPGAPPTA